MTPASAFSTDTWERTAELRARIDAGEFLRRLGDGTLPARTFRNYLEQDVRYLAGYGRALALLAARAPDVAASAFWAGAAHQAAVVESSLHADLLGSGALPPAEERATAEGPEASPTTLAYVSYLVATAATAPYPVAAAAVLPCFWVYADVAHRLAASTAAVGPDHPYARWTAAYDGEEYRRSVAAARDLVDAAAAAADAATRAAMHDAFALATRYELLFWESAHAHETW